MRSGGAAIKRGRKPIRPDEFAPHESVARYGAAQRGVAPVNVREGG